MHRRRKPCCAEKQCHRQNFNRFVVYFKWRCMHVDLTAYETDAMIEEAA